MTTKPLLRHRILASTLLTGALLAAGAAGAQNVTVPGVAVGVGTRVENNTSVGPVGAIPQGSMSAGARTDASGVSVPSPGGVTAGAGGVVSNTTGTVGGTLRNVTGAATSGTAAVRQQGAGTLRPGSMGSGARIDGAAQGSGALVLQK